MANDKEKKDLLRMSRMDQLAKYGIGATVEQAKNILRMKYNSELARKWCVWLVGESGIGKNHLQEQLAEELSIEYLWFPCKGVAPEDIRGFPMPVRKLNGEEAGKTYSGDLQGLVDLTYDYYHKEPIYKFQLLEYLEKAFDPNWKGIIHFDEFPQASKEVQEILYMFFYDRRLDDKKLSDGALIVASMNPPSMNEYMLAKIGKAAQDRPSILYVEGSAKEWINWARHNGINATLIDFITQHPSVFDVNKGRALHRFSDDLSMFGTLDPSALPPELKIIAYSDIDVESANKFAKFVQELFDISGVSLLLGEKQQFSKLKKMLKSESKSVHLYSVQQEMLSALEEPETYLKDLWKKNKGDASKSWDEVSERVVEYIKLLKGTSSEDNMMDTAVGLLKEITKMSLEELENRINAILKKKENRDLYKEVLRCLAIQVNSRSEENPDQENTLAMQAQ